MERPKIPNPVLAVAIESSHGMPVSPSTLPTPSPHSSWKRGILVGHAEPYNRGACQTRYTALSATTALALGGPPIKQEIVALIAS